MDKATRDFAVETTAQIGVIRAAVSVMLADLLRQVPQPGREVILATFINTLSDVPPGAPFPTPEGTQFFELVAEAMPSHAERFVSDVRRMLE